MLVMLIFLRLLPIKDNLVLSSCQNAVVVKAAGVNGDIVNLSNNVDIPEIDSSNLNAATNLSVSRLYTSAYFVGTVNGQSSLLRYELGADGTWQGPQLLSEGVSQMTVNFGYLKNCVAASSPAAASNIFTLHAILMIFLTICRKKLCLQSFGLV